MLVGHSGFLGRITLQDAPGCMPCISAFRLLVSSFVCSLQTFCSTV